MNVNGYAFEVVTELDFDKAIDAVKQELSKVGFGVLTEIDLQGTLKKKIDFDMPKYKILGACNPKFASKAVTAEPNIGLLLPCNLIVTERNGKTFIAVLNPNEALSVVENKELRPMAEEVTELLKKALSAFEA